MLLPILKYVLTICLFQGLAQCLARHFLCIKPLPNPPVCIKLSVYKLTVFYLCPLSFPSGFILLLTNQQSAAPKSFLTEKEGRRDLEGLLILSPCPKAAVPGLCLILPLEKIQKGKQITGIRNDFLRALGQSLTQLFRCFNKIIINFSVTVRSKSQGRTSVLLSASKDP